MLKLFKPRYWPTWFAIALIRPLAWLPYDWLIFLGKKIGRLYARVAAQRRRIAEINIHLCFSQWTSYQKQSLLKQHFEQLGISLLEVPLAWWGSAKKIAALTEIHGIEHLQYALQKGRGVLLLSAHFNTPELSGRILNQYQPFIALYRPSNNPVIEWLMSRIRKKGLVDIIPRHNVRAIIKALRQNQVIWYAVDQNAARKEALFVNFFGILASTNTATARLARLTGAAVVPFKAIRKQDGRGYALYLEPAWQNYPSGDLYADTQRINDWVENWVREHPEQYLWIHRRFRTRPNRSDPSFYA